MKRLSFIIFLFSAMSLADTTNVNGNVSGSWTTSNSPYIVTNNLVLQPTDTLTINAGVEIRFDGNYRFDIFGTFLAVGTEADSITFTRNGSTNWMSLNFADDADDNSQMQYCIVEYGSESGYDPYWGVVNFNLSSPRNQTNSSYRSFSSSSSPINSFVFYLTIHFEKLTL